MGLAVVVLAAGEGTRMKSRTPKVLHRICGEPLIYYVLEAVSPLSVDKLICVIGHGADDVKKLLGKYEPVDFAVQEQQLGTAHAVSVTEGLLKDHAGHVLVLCGDTPLITTNTLEKLCSLAAEGSSLLTTLMDDPTGYGRIVRDANNKVKKIVEEKDADAGEKAIKEVNTGIYCFERSALFKAIDRVGQDNLQGEFYLTDVVEIMVEENLPISVHTTDDPSEVMGINSRVQLSEAERAMRQRINGALMDDGVTIIEPEITFISPKVQVGQDSIIFPLSFLEGNSRIGENCHVGPGSRIIDSIIGDDVLVENALIREARIEDRATIGPYCYLRPGSVVGQGSKIGGFVEIKNTKVGKGSKIPHLSYIGDTDVGDGVNIGAGSITCNFDGQNKHKTVIKDGAFVGSDTMLVAPVTIGEGAYTGAGSVINKDVPEGDLGIERCQQSNVKGWAKKRKRRTTGKRSSDGERVE